MTDTSTTTSENARGQRHAPGARGARRTLRRILRLRGHDDRGLLPAFMPIPARQARKRAVFPRSGGGRIRRIEGMQALPTPRRARPHGPNDSERRPIHRTHAAERLTLGASGQAGASIARASAAQVQSCARRVAEDVPRCRAAAPAEERAEGRQERRRCHRRGRLRIDQPGLQPCAAQARDDTVGLSPGRGRRDSFATPRATRRWGLC